MARIIQMVDTETGKVVNMYSADAREVIDSGNPRYKPYTAKGKAAIEAKPEKLVAPGEDRLQPADVTQASRGQGVRGGDVVAPAAQPPANAPTVPQILPEAPRVDIPIDPQPLQPRPVGQVLPEQPVAVPADSPASPSPSLVAGVAGKEGGEDFTPAGSAIPDILD